MLSGPAHAKYLGLLFSYVGIGMFSAGIFCAEKVTAQNILSLYIHYFLSEFLILAIKTIDDINYLLV